MRLSVVVITVVVLQAGPVLAFGCIGSADFVERVKEDHRAAQEDLKVQKKLVSTLAREAELIVVAEALNDWQPGHITEFRIIYVVKGAAKLGSAARYNGGPAVAALACTPASETFRNTLTSKGESYLLYVKNGNLTRAGKLLRSTAEIALAEELELIENASNKSLERSRDR